MLRDIMLCSYINQTFSELDYMFIVTLSQAYNNNLLRNQKLWTWFNPLIIL